MAFAGFTEDGDPKFDTKEDCIAWAREHRRLKNEPVNIWVQRDWAPMWLARLVRGTILDFVAYYEEK